jgi:hypothetical protein
LQCLGLITIQVNGVETRGRVSIQHCLGAVPGKWVEESNCGIRRKSDSQSRRTGLRAFKSQLNCLLARFLQASNRTCPTLCSLMCRMRIKSALW